MLQGSIAAAMAKNLQTAGHALFVCTDEYDRIWEMIPKQQIPGKVSGFSLLSCIE